MSAYQQRAFTLIELMVVIAVISILLGLLLGVIPSVLSGSRAKQALTEIQQLVTALDQYESHFGVYPPSAMVGSGAPNTTNQVNETLVACLSTTLGGGPFYRFDDARQLGNSDKDHLVLPLSQLTSSYLVTTELHELLDPFGNPYVYINGADLNEVFTAEYLIAGKPVAVRPALPGAQGAWPGYGRYQLLSAGENGMFERGSGDDIVSWAR